MIKKIFLISVLFCWQTHSYAAESQPRTIVSTIFKAELTNQSQAKRLENIIENIMNANSQTTAQAIPLALKKLNQELLALDKKINDKHAQESTVDRKLFYQKFILESTIEYLSRLSTAMPEQRSFLDRFWQSAKDLIGRSDPHAEKIANDILEFNTYIVDNYLLDYDKLLLFFAGMKKAPLPQVINFWSDPAQQLKLQKRAATLRTNIKTQWIEEIAMVALQSLLLGGEGMYKQWLDEQAQQEFLALQKKINNASDDLNTFLKKLADKQKNEIVPAILNSFKTGQKNISDQYGIINQNQSKELNYLFQSINLDSPVQHYLMFPIIPWDQYFENGIMLTPNNGHPWYNIFQVNYGNLGWIFDPVANSFIQTGLVFFGTPFWTNKDNSGSDPSQNAIFTEYISSQNSYEIEIDMNLINCSYPFFAGVMFNRARWISADPERIWQYRLLGLYGNQTDPKDPKTRSIVLGFGQQIIQFDTDPTTGQKTETILSPLQLATTQAPLFTLPTVDIDTLDKEPILYTLKITTAPTQVQLTLSKKDVHGAATQLYSTTLANLDNYLAIFHGIGFMSPGCQTEFKIIKPDALVYTKEQLETFSAKTSQLLAKIPNHKKRK